MPVQYPMKLRSQLPGRERWEIDFLKDNPNWAAAVEHILRTEAGVRSAEANPLTGRVLVEFYPSRITTRIEELLRNALDFGPMTPAEFAPSRPRSVASDTIVMAATAELGCLLLKIALFGSMCPLASVAMVSAAFLFRNRWHRDAVPPVRFVVNQSSGVGHHQNGTQIMEYGRDDGIDAPQCCQPQPHGIDAEGEAIILPDDL